MVCGLIFWVLFMLELADGLRREEEKWVKVFMCLTVVEAILEVFVLGTA